MQQVGYWAPWQALGSAGELVGGVGGRGATHYETLGILYSSRTPWGKKVVEDDLQE